MGYHMRQRHIKRATVENLTDMGVLFEPTLLHLPNQKRIHLEIGSGKGHFITSLADHYKDEHFIALEIDRDVCYRIAEKKEAMQLTNLTILCTDAKILTSWIPTSSIDTIYLNFSDPWPKKKHHKRRLTYPTMLNMYKTLLKQEGILQFRTDHKELFDDSITYFEHIFNITDIQYALPESPFMTEYEVKKRTLGPIYQLKGKPHYDTKAL